MEYKYRVIGVTGPIHAGKSTVSSYIASKGYELFDADKVAHQFYQTPTGFDFLENIFGKRVFKNEQVDFTLLRTLLSSDALLKQRVQDEVFEYVRSKAAISTKENPLKPIVLDVPLLYDSKIYELCDYVILVKSSANKRRDRLLGEGKDADALMKLNHNYPLKETEAIANIVIINDGNLSELYCQIDAILN